MPDLDKAYPSTCPRWLPEPVTLPEIEGEMDWRPVVVALLAGILAGRYWLKRG